MKQSFTLLFLLLSLSLPAQIQRITQTTYEANSPSVWAKNFSASYGIKPSVLDGLAKLYKKDGLDSLARQKKVEKLIRDFQVVVPKEQKKLELSAADRQKLGIADRPDVAEGLEFHLYTQSANSPAVNALGNVKIWYGIPKKAFLGIVAVLEEKQSQIEDFDKKLREQVEKFEELEKSLANREDEMAKEAKALLDEGKVDEAVKVLGDRRYALKKQRERTEKREAEAAFDYAEGLVLQLKYDSAAVQYKDAVDLDPTNSKYLLAYGYHLNNIARYDEAIVFYQKALAIDTISFKDQPEKAAVLYNNIGEAHHQKGEYDRAIAYYVQALAIDSVVFGNKHISIARDYNNLGAAWQSKGDYDRAIVYYEHALAVDSIVVGNKHPAIAVRFGNLGECWRNKGEYARAISFGEKALSIFIQTYGNEHPGVATQYNNLGLVWNSKGEYNRAITFFEKALAIDSAVLGIKHPKVATRYNNLGEVWRSKEDYDYAITFYEKALAIDSAVLGIKHPKVATRYYNLGLAWNGKGEYDRAIVYFEQCEIILTQFFKPNHPYCIATNQLFSHTANDRGIELFREKRYAEALPYFQKALENAVQAEDWSFSLTCLNNVGSMHKRLGQYAEGLAALEKGLVRSEQINLGIDEEIKKLPPETLQKPEVQAKIAEMKNATLIRRMRYHKAGCLVGLGHKKEADELYQQLLKEAREAKDDRLLEDLKNDGIGN